MKKNVYKVYFNLPYNCGSVNSLAYDCHTTILAETIDECLHYFWDNIQVCGVHVKDGIRVTNVDLVEIV